MEPNRSVKNICRASHTEKILGAFCLTEPQAGSDAARNRHLGDAKTETTYRLNGTKSWVTNGGEAGPLYRFLQKNRNFAGCGLYLGARQKKRPRGRDGISCRTFIFPASGFARYEDKMGLRTFAFGRKLLLAIAEFRK